ncbi:hypothetical protein AX16_004671 [Volvariella volvacea WC 439]|nr:hypothetical protein AX16_004671 [Volvariella volvacea WC 439]
MPMRVREDYIFFWKPSEVHGWASQWYYSPFEASVEIEGGKEEAVVFPTAEHWMMVQKALLFHDSDVAREVLQVGGKGGGDMAYVKSLGRKVQNFDEGLWVERREDIVLQGNLHKFRQNPELRGKLLATGEKTIVEASPRDRIWGIGYGEKNAIDNRNAKWGLNLLGKALMETRRVLKEELDKEGGIL